jgi:archaellum component FlaC
MRRMAAQMQGLQHQMVEMGGQTDQMALQIVADLDPNAAAGEIERMQERLAGIHQQAGEIRNEVTALRGLLRHENVPDILNELRTDLGNLRHDLGHVDEQMDGLSKQLAAIG